MNRIGNEIMRIGQDEAKEAPGEEVGGPDSREKSILGRYVFGSEI